MQDQDVGRAGRRRVRAFEVEMKDAGEIAVGKRNMDCCATNGCLLRRLCEMSRQVKSSQTEERA